MNALPADIAQEIARSFAAPADQAHVTEQLCSLWTRVLNVGPDQLARCLLVLAAGDVARLDALFASDFGGDPRDLIVAAMEASGNQIHWGIGRFGDAPAPAQRRPASKKPPR